MRVLTPQIMNQVFDVTDALELSREAIQVPLVLEGEGTVRRVKSGKIEIALPDTDDLGPFLAALPERLRQMGGQES
jgi:hypothetical protein